MQNKLIGLLFLALSTNVIAIGLKKESKTIIQQTTTTTTTTTIVPSTSDDSNEEKSNNTANAKNSKLTGIPQVDYIYDPNLPRELRGYNLSSYPFFSTVPPEEDIHFKCDGLHDGFYAAIEFKCQVYHHCVYGIRHDFLCANFTAFDQKTFICHFVSDVDCEGSKKYWNRNDALYMPTTTTSTTTTTTEPPPSVYRRPVRPQRPLRRPLKRRPVDDYYYDEEYRDEYYDDQVNRRPVVNRSRPRKPVVDYDYDLDTERRRPAGNRYRLREDVDEVDEDYEVPRTPVKETKANERKKPNAYLGASVEARTIADEIETSVEERPVSRPFRKNKHRVVNEAEDEPDSSYISRRFSGRRRVNDKRPSPDNLGAADQQNEEARKEIKSRVTPHPPAELITPKAVSQTVYARPRIPPRIARPVPNNEKTKYQYAAQKTLTTVAPSVHALPEDYAEEQLSEDYDDVDYDYGVLPRSYRRRRIQDGVDTLEQQSVGKPRFRNEQRLKTQRPRYQKKSTHAPASASEDDYDSDIGAVDVIRPTGKKSTLYARRQGLPFAQSYAETDEEPVPLNNRKHKQKINMRSQVAELENTQPRNNNKNSANKDETAEISDTEINDELLQNGRNSRRPQEEATNKNVVEKKLLTPVRVVKRPFLPSRGGSPYLPRGLQVVGVAPKRQDLVDVVPSTRKTSEQLKNTKSSRVTSLKSTTVEQQSDIEEEDDEHNEQIDKHEGRDDDFGGEEFEDDTREQEQHDAYQQQKQQKPVNKQEGHDQLRHNQNAQLALDMFYENDYDVTINDALNPTFKPLSSSQTLPFQNQALNRKQRNSAATAFSLNSPTTVHLV